MFRRATRSPSDCGREMKAIAACCILAIGVVLNAQVVLSRRDYAEHGRTFSQIWMADAGNLDFRRLTNSARDHAEPVCSRDVEPIYFVSDRDPERSRNSYGDYHSGEREIWSYDPHTGQERVVWRTSSELGLDLVGTASNGGVLARVGTELRSLAQNPWVIDDVDEAALSPDGRRLALVIVGQDRNTTLLLADSVTGQSQTEVGKYALPKWSPDGKRIAAFVDGGLAILDATTGKELERAALPKHDAPSQDIVWSPDGLSVMAGVYGENGGSGDPQNDYFLLDPGARNWRPTLTARRLLWLQGETILYLRPYGTTALTPGSRHSVWTSQLAIYDPATHKDASLTSGLVLNDFLSTCRR